MLRAHRLAGAVAIVLILASPARAQQPPAQSKPQGSQPQGQPQAQPAAASAESMGVSLKSIRKQLDAMPPPKKSAGVGMRYDFFVDVLGKRPPIEFFKDFDLSTQGGVRWGGVTHQEILNAVTPFPFRNYGGGVDLLAIGRKQ